MNAKIKQWLNNPEKTFEDGLALYEHVKSDTKKDAFFRSAPTFKQGTIQFNILAQELTRISRIIDQRQPEVKTQVNPPAQLPNIQINPTGNKKNIARASKLVITDVNTEVEYSKLPEDMKAKFDEIKELSKKLGGLKLLLDTVTTNEERKQVADDLCTSYDRRKELWIELDAWKESNHTNNSNDKPVALTPEEIKKQIKLKRDNINRALKNKEPKNKAKNEKSIKKWEKEIDELEKLMKEPA